jgi:YVTN family beta-propeller protein
VVAQPVASSSCSSIKDLKTTTTEIGDEWNFDITPFAQFGFTKTQIKQLATSSAISAADVEQSLIEFSYDLDNNALPSIKTTKINFLMGLLWKGQSYVSEGFKSEQELMISEMAKESRRDKAPKIHVIDTQVNSVVAAIKKEHINDPGLGWFESTFAFNKKNGLLYFTDMIFSNVSILNTRNHILEDEAIKYPEGENLSGIAINPENNKLYVLSFSSLFTTDLLTRKIIDEISIGKEALDLALAANGTKLYVTDRAIDVVLVFDVTQQSKLIKKIPVGNKPQTLRLSSDGSKLYVGNAGSNDISVIDVVTDKVVRVIAINN